MVSRCITNPPAGRALTDTLPQLQPPVGLSVKSLRRPESECWLGQQNCGKLSSDPLARSARPRAGGHFVRPTFQHSSVRACRAKPLDRVNIDKKPPVFVRPSTTTPFLFGTGCRRPGGRIIKLRQCAAIAELNVRQVGNIAQFARRSTFPPGAPPSLQTHGTGRAAAFFCRQIHRQSTGLTVPSAEAFQPPRALPLLHPSHFVQIEFAATLAPSHGFLTLSHLRASPKAARPSGITPPVPPPAFPRLLLGPADQTQPDRPRWWSRCFAIADR